MPSSQVGVLPKTNQRYFFHFLLGPAASMLLSDIGCRVSHHTTISLSLSLDWNLNKLTDCLGTKSYRQKSWNIKSQPRQTTSRDQSDVKFAGSLIHSSLKWIMVFFLFSQKKYLCNSIYFSCFSEFVKSVEILFPGSSKSFWLDLVNYVLTGESNSQQHMKDQICPIGQLLCLWKLGRFEPSSLSLNSSMFISTFVVGRGRNRGNRMRWNRVWAFWYSSHWRTYPMRATAPSPSLSVIGAASLSL